jgi:hypothetical protein
MAWLRIEFESGNVRWVNLGCVVGMFFDQECQTVRFNFSNGGGAEFSPPAGARFQVLEDLDAVNEILADLDKISVAPVEQA